MAERETPDHTDKPVAENSAANVGERLTGVSDAQDPDGLLTLDDVERAKGGADRVGGDSALGSASHAGAAPTANLSASGDAPSLGALNSGADSLGDDAELPTPETEQTPWGQGIGTDT